MKKTFLIQLFEVFKVLLMTDYDCIKEKKHTLSKEFNSTPLTSKPKSLSQVKSRSELRAALSQELNSEQEKQLRVAALKCTATVFPLHACVVPWPVCTKNLIGIQPILSLMSWIKSADFTEREIIVSWFVGLLGFHFSDTKPFHPTTFIQV